MFIKLDYRDFRYNETKMHYLKYIGCVDDQNISYIIAIVLRCTHCTRMLALLYSNVHTSNDTCHTKVITRSFKSFWLYVQN